MDELKFYEEQLKSENLEQALMGVQIFAQIHDRQARKILIDNLNHPLWQVRNSIVEVLSEILTEEDVPLLIEKIKSQDAKERNSAISIMQERGDIVIPYLVKNLKSDDVDVRILSLNTLGLVNAKEAIDPIKEMLNDEDQNVREAAIEALGRLKAEKEVELLTELMEKEEDEWSKIPYIVALGEIGDPYPIPVLLQYLDDEILSYPSIEALGKIGDERGFLPILRFLKSDDEDTVKLAIEALISIYESSSKVLELEGNEWILDVLREKVSKRVDKKDVEKILSIIVNEEDTGKVEKIFSYLKWARIPIGVSTLLPFLEKVEINESTEEYLLIAGEKDCDILGKILDFSTHPLVTKSLIKYIAEKQKFNLEKIERIFESPYPEVRAIAGELLLPHLEDESVLRKFLKDVIEKERDREVLNKISVFIGKKKLCRETLSELLKSEDPILREFAVRTLSIMGDKESFELIYDHLNDPEPSIRAVVVRSAGYFFSKHPEFIIETTESDIALLLNDDDFDVKDETVIALGRIGTDEAINILLNAIDGYDDLNFPLVFKTLAEIKNEKVKEKFLEIIEKGTDERKLIFAIEKFPDAIDEKEKSKYVFSIAKYLDSDDEYFLSVVLNSLSRLDVQDEAILERIRKFVNESKSWSILEPSLIILGNQKYKKAAGEIVEKAVNEVDNEIVLKATLYALKKMDVFSKEVVYKMFTLKQFSQELFDYLSYFGKDNYEDIVKLTETLRNSSEKRAMLKVLKDLGGDSAVRKLKDYLSDPVISIRGTSYISLMEISKKENNSNLLEELKEMDLERIDPFLKDIF